MKVLVLGAGKMVQSILFGLRDTHDLSGWMIFSPSGTSAEKLAQLVGARAIQNLDDATSVDFVLVGCKPQQLKSLKETIGERFKNLLFLSLLAAVSENDQRSILGINSLVRCMPNLPVEFRKGVILLSSQSASHELSSFQALFSELGTSLVVNEEELEELTLLTGSGPALYYEFTRSLAGSFHSLDDRQRESLARAVMVGASITVEHDKGSLQELTQNVTSKAGVTIAILEAWRKLGLESLIQKGITNGMERTLEIKSKIQN